MSITAHIDVAFLAAVAGPAPTSKVHQQTDIIAKSAEILPSLLDRFSINTAERIEQFIAQVAHECDGFCTTREYATGAAYESRSDLGNVVRGDGTRFRGRGLMQLTGRANYRAFTAWMRKLDPACPDFEVSPELVEQFPWAAWVAVYFWTVNGLNALADRGDLVGITRKINGGKNGLDDRIRREALAEKLLVAKLAVAPIAAEIVASNQGFPVLYRGVKNQHARVEQLQRLLQDAGYYHLAIDGDFGAGTEGALRTYQSRAGLTVDGLAGAKTYAALTRLLNVSLTDQL